MKSKLYLILLFCSSIFLDAQFMKKHAVSNLRGDDDKLLGWGFWLSINQFYFDVETNEKGVDFDNDSPTIYDEPSTSFSVGLSGKLRVNSYIDIRVEPGVHFANRTLTFTEFPEGDDDRTRLVTSTYFDLPLLVKFHGNEWKNNRPYLQTGVGYSYNSESNETSTQDNEDGIFRLTTHNFNWQAEMGWEFYFKRFKFTPSIKGIFFLNNELINDNAGSSDAWAGSISSLRTRAFLVTFRFE